jgi:hypothetical protein
LKIENKVEISGTPAKDEIDTDEYMYFAVNSMKSLIGAHARTLTHNKDFQQIIKLALINKLVDDVAEKEEFWR